MTLKLLLPAVVLTCYSLFSGQPGFPYEQAWKKVDSLIRKKGLPKSALAEVNKIYAAAKRENQEAQWVKAVIYMMSLQEGSDEQSTTNFNLIEKEIRSAPPRVAAVLSSLEAEQLYFYLRQNRYRLQQAAEIQNDSSSDIATWTSVRLNAEIRSRYLQSLKPENLLKQTPVSQFDAVVNRGNARYLRPTLYDLLAYRALDYFQSDDPEQFAENTFGADTGIFSPADHFVQWKIPDTDSSNQAIAFRLYQDLLKFHAGDASPD
ncbi:MAG TPA: hypothetical protein VG890_12200, partial [Puia sp.]|nr:hypothetical protein [Puia sp.]